MHSRLSVRRPHPPNPLRGRVHSRSKSSDFGRGGRAGEFGSRNGGSPPRLWWRQQQSVRLAFLRDARQKNLAKDQLSEDTRSADAASSAAGAEGTLGPTLGPSRRGRGAVRGPHARPGRWRTPWHREIWSAKSSSRVICPPLRDCQEPAIGGSYSLALCGLHSARGLLCIGASSTPCLTIYSNCYHSQGSIE